MSTPKPTAISIPTRIKPVITAAEPSPATGGGDGDTFDVGVELVIGVGAAVGAIVGNATIVWLCKSENAQVHTAQVPGTTRACLPEMSHNIGSGTSGSGEKQLLGSAAA